MRTTNAGPLPAATPAPQRDPTIDPDALVERYVAVWMEPEPAARRRRIREVWAEDGAQILEPPQAVREAAREIGFPHPALEVRGHQALEFRVARAHEEFVAGGRYAFHAQGGASRVGNALRFRWEMRAVPGGEVAAVGLDLLLLDGAGRIRVDYQFIER